MTPEEMAIRITELEQKLDALNNANSIPFDVDQAFRERLGADRATLVSVASKTTNSENQAVNEGGSATYQVLKGPDGWLSLEIAGTIYVIPHYGIS